ncbi:hypothetical protein Clacol_010412 [Clathrus columnatus]|uniref:Uncharacterized protein n=1 Tax=Clathrus columnatus TaxID=1419009 RepID=A0AAV5AQN6_9AGAM|nr:hypothetical protein Clacol_010412 [Clathrus columnatus]
MVFPWMLDLSSTSYSDNPGDRTLDAASYFDPVFSTIENCIQFCDERNYPFAGAEFGRNIGPAIVTEFSTGLPGVWNLVGSFNNTTPNSQPFTVEAVIAGTPTTSGSVQNCLTWCAIDLGCSLCSISDGGVCECGNTLSPNRITASPGTSVCSLNTSEICGDHGIRVCI